SPLVVDLVHTFGAPQFYQDEQGRRARRSAAAYLATSPALLVFCGLALTGVLFAWQGSLVPPRALPGPDTAEPGLDAFVDSLAALYAGTRDHPRVLARYRELTPAVGGVIVGQESAVRLAFITLLCSGHSLIEGVPGVAKTLLVQALAAAVDVRFGRVQFTPDLMPSDIIGTSILDPRAGD